jgi:hypothetical protein
MLGTAVGTALNSLVTAGVYVIDKDQSLAFDGDTGFTSLTTGGSMFGIAATMGMIRHW